MLINEKVVEWGGGAEMTGDRSIERLQNVDSYEMIG